MPGPYLIDDDDVPNHACHWTEQRKVFRDFDGHFHCVYQKNVSVDILRLHVFYGYSEDFGVTWETEDLIPELAAGAPYCNIVVDSNRDPHVVYLELEPGKTYGDIKYLHRSNGVWSSPESLRQGIRGTNRVGGFDVGEDVVGDASGAKIEIGWRAGSYLIPAGYSHDPGFIINEWIRGQDSGAKMRYQGFIERAQNISMAIDLTDQIYIAFFLNIGGVLTRIAHIFKDLPGGSWTWPDSVMDQEEHTTIAVGPENMKNIVVQDFTQFFFTSGARNNWLTKENFATGTSAAMDFSMTVDLDGNVHVAMSQTGLGGANPLVLNIKYYKRTPAGAWSGPEHVTDDVAACIHPSIAVDKNGIISVFFLGRIGALGNDAIFIRQKSGGSWDSSQALISRSVSQNEINSLCSLFPLEGDFRPNYPDGYAFIFNGRIETDPGFPYHTVEFYHDIHQALVPPPTDLWCEQKTNPNDVQDPEPEFSAVYHETK